MCPVHLLNDNQPRVVVIFLVDGEDGVIEVAADHIVPSQPALAVRTRCLIYAKRAETEVRVRVTGAGDEVMLAPGIMKLARERARLSLEELAAQVEGVGAEIGRASCRERV